MTVSIRQGHVVDVLAAMEPESVHLICTSPPYWNLRAYNTEPQVWPELDGRAPCVGGTDLRTREPLDGHEWVDASWRDSRKNDDTAGDKQRSDPGSVGWRNATKEQAFCTRCHSWRGELGQEPTVELYIAHLVAVFRGVRRVLRRDGTCWINLSGSYLNNAGGQNGTSGHVSAKAMSANAAAGRQDRTGALPRGYWLRPLNFVDTPGLLAGALQRDGWIWRADIALVKKSPLPESVQGWRFEKCRVKTRPGAIPRRGDPIEHDWGTQTPPHPTGGAWTGETAEWADCPGCPKCAAQEGYVLRRGNGRPTRAWERLMVFAREPGAFWDSEATRETVTQSSIARVSQNDGHPKWNGVRDRGYPGSQQTMDIGKMVDPARGRNLRDWQFWPTTGGAGREEHYAAYPIALPSLAIRAGTSERGCCPNCGAPWARVVERERGDVDGVGRPKSGPGYGGYGASTSTLSLSGGSKEWAERGPKSRILGWRPTCSCGATGSIPAVVLDPFAGSGSSLIAADRLGRDAIGIDLNSSYTEMAVRRVTRDAPLFADVALHATPAEPVQPRAMALALALDGTGAGEAGDEADEAAGG